MPSLKLLAHPLFISFFPVSNFNHPDCQFAVPDSVKDSVSSLAQPVPFIPCQFFAARRPRVQGKLFDSLVHLS